MRMKAVGRSRNGGDGWARSLIWEGILCGPDRDVGS